MMACYEPRPVMRTIHPKKMKDSVTKNKCNKYASRFILMRFAED